MAERRILSLIYSASEKLFSNKQAKSISSKLWLVRAVANHAKKWVINIVVN